MYPNIKYEKLKKNITLAKMVADPRIHCNISTLSLKLNGKAPLTFKEAIVIKSILNTDMPLEELFKEE